MVPFCSRENHTCFLSSYIQLPKQSDGFRFWICCQQPLTCSMHLGMVYTDQPKYIFLSEKKGKYIDAKNKQSYLILPQIVVVL